MDEICEICHKKEEENEMIYNPSFDVFYCNSCEQEFMEIEME